MHSLFGHWVEVHNFDILERNKRKIAKNLKDLVCNNEACLFFFYVPESDFY